MPSRDRRVKRKSMTENALAIPEVLPKDIDEMEVDAMDLAPEYWSPGEGECRRLVFVGTSTCKVPDYNDRTKQVDLLCAVFIDPETRKIVINGSKRLVAVFVSNKIPGQTPVQIVCDGRKQNKSNTNSSDHWTVQLLRAKK